MPGFQESSGRLPTKLRSLRYFHPLHQHAERVALFLSQGNTIEAALKEANKRVQTCDSVGVKMDMVLKGDPYSRLQYVYMSATEWDETKRYSWYLVYSP